jgi:hypothetical protein
MLGTSTVSRIASRIRDTVPATHDQAANARHRQSEPSLAVDDGTLCFASASSDPAGSRWPVLRIALVVHIDDLHTNEVDRDQPMPRSVVFDADQVHAPRLLSDGDGTGRLLAYRI